MIEDIKEIKNDMSAVKIWIMSGVIAGLLVLIGEALYFGGYIRQIDINTQNIEKNINRLDRIPHAN